MQKFEGLQNTLFVPLVARINISKRFPEYFIDSKAVELEAYLPESADKGSSEYSDMASASRYYNMDKMVISFVKEYSTCNLVYLGAGLDTAYDRLNENSAFVRWYEVDLPEVIETRKLVFGQREAEILIPGDMFGLEWIKEIETTLPTLFVVSGVFQYFYEEEVVSFIKSCAKAFPNGEIIFDATSESGLKFTNRFIKRTGNADTLMHFSVDNSKAFADKCGVDLLEEKTFFQDALRILGRKLTLLTRIFMKVTEIKKRLIILHLRLN